MIKGTYSSRIVIYIAGLALVMLSPRLGAQSLEEQREQDRKRIQDLENRLSVVEGQLEALLRERSVAASPEPVVPPSTVPPLIAATGPRPIQAAAPKAGRQRFEMPPELIPEVGKIGAEVGIVTAEAANPFSLDHGPFYGGYIDLPVVDRPRWLHGKISYEIMIGISRSQTRVTTTSNVAQVANLAVLTAVNSNGGMQNINDALTGSGAAPFPVSTSNMLNLRLLEVVPFSFRYTTNVLDRWRLRPYGVLGFGTYVTLHAEVPTTSLGVRQDATLSPAMLQAVEQAFGGTSPFGTPLVGGQIGQSPELAARGLPAGSGNVDIGLAAGVGIEFRLTRTISLGFDGRYNKISGPNGNFETYGTRLGFHF